ncbi:Type IV pilus biogenesis protein PilN [Georgfuchsia toluolica]|uniref:Type IV pilus biogenesis protein PilN n=1 Tax=Georgfuchsia toluolica TaxID=424218 RepID=A0A916NA62_9PROT|nr:PilN domain-containing protein [Georgfuchsia toluolica]CAG4884952.1 Type IV pilus biogenesis protein PilN [Georgfuchsia toluolica]
MIRVNLLPHREEKRKARRQQFFAVAGLLVVLAGVIWFLGFTVINGYINTQQATNEYLEKEINVLKKQIEEISSLKEQTDALLARKQVIESLQGSRAQTVTLFTELLSRVPDGIRLVSLGQDGRKIAITGEALSEARVSTLLRSLEESPLFEHAVPIEIRAIPSASNNSLFTFQLSVMIAQPSVDATKAKPRTGGAAKG